MITVRPAAERGATRIGWLNAKHSFSFGQYYDPRHMGFRSLRVINDDTVSPGSGFGRHGHRDMEIITWVLSGALAHEDSTGGRSTLYAGDVQRMSAGRGVMHSEFNHSAQGQTHFLQIWIEPAVRGIDPGYEQKHFEPEQKRGRLRLVASREGADGSVTVHADVRLYAGLFDGAEQARLALDPARKVYVHLIGGELSVNGHILRGGDALKLVAESQLELSAGRQAEVLVFDLAA